jgi:class 3 adenylate cyclase
MNGQNHQLAAILFADIVGYTAMMQKDETSAIENINRFRETVEIISTNLMEK